MMQFSILIPALVSRRQQRQELELSLRGQASAFPDVEVIVDEDAGEVPSGTKRNRLLIASTGRYFSFVDDDDEVDRKYVSRIYYGTREGPDVVSFKVLLDGPKRTRVHDFSIKHEGDRTHMNHFEGRVPQLGYMANHLCAWRRELAEQVAFPPIGYNDDVFWYQPLLRSGLVETEVHINAVLYIYKQNLETTTQQTPERIRATRKWAGGGIECFLQAARIFVAVSSIDRTKGQRYVLCHQGVGKDPCIVDRTIASRYLTVRVK